MEKRQGDYFPERNFEFVYSSIYFPCCRWPTHRVRITHVTLKTKLAEFSEQDESLECNTLGRKNRNSVWQRRSDEL